VIAWRGGKLFSTSPCEQESRQEGVATQWDGAGCGELCVRSVMSAAEAVRKTLLVRRNATAARARASDSREGAHPVKLSNTEALHRHQQSATEGFPRCSASQQGGMAKLCTSDAGS
jgi:hypothetical protein